MQHLSLFELNNLVKETLDKNLAPSYWVVAEIGEMRMNQTGHCYLELVEKEDNRITAKLRATIWAYTYRNLSTWFEGITGQALQPGLKVLFNVTVQFHELYGLSANIRDIDANFTLGERAQKRKRILEQLTQDGVLDMNKMHRLPSVPQRIAIISSPTAAGFGDFMDQILKNKYRYQFEVKLFKAIMQGDKASESIINAMLQVHHSAEDYDVLIIIRGGGSQIDLDCFDDYDLAAHIAQFSIPVITGIGHERDETIADLVAHTTMKTPTAVAEFLISGVRTFEELLDNYYARLHSHTSHVLNYEAQKLSTLGYQLQSAAKDCLSGEKFRQNQLINKLRNATQGKLGQLDKILDLAEKTINLLDPQRILKRGYTLTSVDGKIIDVKKIKPGDTLRTESAHQVILSTVEKINEKKDGEEKDKL